MSSEYIISWLFTFVTDCLKKSEKNISDSQNKKRLRAKLPKGVCLTGILSKNSIWQPGCHGTLALDPKLCVPAFRRICFFQ